jgi:tRNA A37 threonylcarbamoyladenosine modification protein TsaB
MTRALAIDTTSDVLSLGVRHGDGPLHQVHDRCGAAMNRRLLTTIDALLHQAGLTTALVGVDTLALLAAAVDPAQAPARGHALLRCTRREVYLATYAWEQGAPRREGEIALLPLPELLAAVGTEPVVLREHDGVHGGPDPRLEALRPMALRHAAPDAALLMEVGLALFARGEPLPEAAPIYLKSAAFRTWQPRREAP